MKRFVAGLVALASLLFVVLGFASTANAAPTKDVAQVCVGISGEANPSPDCTSDSAVQTDVAGKPVNITVGLKGEQDGTNVTYTVTYEKVAFSTSDQTVDAPMHISGTGGTDFKNLPVSFAAKSDIKPGKYAFCVVFSKPEIVLSVDNTNNGGNKGKTQELAKACSFLTVTAPVVTTTPPPTSTTTAPPTTTTAPPATTVINNGGSGGTGGSVTTPEVSTVPVGAPQTGFGGAATNMNWLLYTGSGLVLAALLFAGYAFFFKRGPKVTE